MLYYMASIKISQFGQIYLDGGFSGVPLGEPHQNQTQVDEATLKNLSLETFNNCDYVGTITIKGAHKRRQLSNNLSAQLLLFIKIKNIIQEYCQFYIINYELHKCTEWVHSHFVFRPIYRSKVPKMRKEIYELITGHRLKKKSYRHRILIEKPYDVSNYIEYMFKEYEDMEYYNFNSHYKLISQPYKCQKENQKENQNPNLINPNPDQNTDPRCQKLFNMPQSDLNLLS